MSRIGPQYHLEAGKDIDMRERGSHLPSVLLTDIEGLWLTSFVNKGKP